MQVDNMGGYSILYSQHTKLHMSSKHFSVAAAFVSTCSYFESREPYFNLVVIEGQTDHYRGGGVYGRECEGCK